jgi:hypothetical protein
VDSEISFVPDSKLYIIITLGNGNYIKTSTFFTIFEAVNSLRSFKTFWCLETTSCNELLGAESRSFSTNSPPFMELWILLPYKQDPIVGQLNAIIYFFLHILFNTIPPSTHKLQSSIILSSDYFDWNIIVFFWSFPYMCNDLCFSPHVNGSTKLIKIKWTGHVARMREIINNFLGAKRKYLS